MTITGIASSLVEKLCHRIPDIRDRAMRAISRKLLSPATSLDVFKSFAVAEGLAHSFLLWINERCDQVNPERLQECLAALEALVDKSEAARRLFIEAGGISFLDDFSQYNAAHAASCRRIIDRMTDSRSDEVHQSVPRQNCSSGGYTTLNAGSEQDRIIDPHDEEAMFDLSIRIKFLVSASPKKAAEELGHLLRLGPWMAMEPGVFVEKPYLLEALCGQLGCFGPSSSPVSDFSPLAEGIREIVRRVPLHEDELSSSSVIPLLVRSALEGLYRRPEQIELCDFILSTILRNVEDEGHSGFRLTCADRELESLVNTIERVINDVFRDDIYQIETFTFADQTSLSLRRFTLWESDYHWRVAELVIKVLSRITRAESIWLFEGTHRNILSHVSDWISDENFYKAREGSKSLASKAAVVLSTVECTVNGGFCKARDMLLSMRKLSCGMSCISDNELHDLYELWVKVPELFGNKTDAKTLIQSFLEVCPNDSDSLLSILAVNRELADAFVTLISENSMVDSLLIKNSNPWLLELVACINCSSPSIFVNLMNERFKVSVPLFTFDALADTSLNGLARSLFAHSESVRKQASLILWKTLGSNELRTNRVFVPDPWRDNDKAYLDLNQYALSPIEVTPEEIQQAIAIAVNDRLEPDIRTASAVQACTLLSNAQETVRSYQFEDGVFESVFQEISHIGGDELFIALCHLGTLLVNHKDYVNVEIESILANLFSQSADRTRAALLLLSRLLFTKNIVAGNVEDRKIYLGLLNRLSQVSFHLLRPPIVVPQKYVSQSPIPLNCFAICVSLYGLVGQSCISTKQLREDRTKQLLVKLATPPVLTEDPKLDDQLHVVCSRYVREVLWPLKQISHNAKLYDAIVSSISCLIDSSPMWVYRFPGFACECLDILWFSIYQSGKQRKALGLSVLPVAVVNLLNRLPESGLLVRRCGLKLLMALQPLGLDMSPCKDLPLIDWVVRSDSDQFSKQVALWLLVWCEECESVLAHVDLNEFCTKLIDQQADTRDSTTNAFRLRLYRKITSKYGIDNSKGIEMALNAIAMINPSISDSVFSELCLIIEETILSDTGRQCLVFDHSALFESVTDLPISRAKRRAVIGIACAIAKTEGTDMAHYLINSDSWSKLFGIHEYSIVKLAVHCQQLSDARLFAYLVHLGLFDCLKNVPVDEVDLVSLLALVNVLRDQLRSGNHASLEPAVDWLEKSGQWLANLVRIKAESCFILIETVATCLLETSLRLEKGYDLIEAVLSIPDKQQSLFDNVSTCRLLTQLLRIPGLVITESNFSSVILDLFAAHESISLPEDNRDSRTRLLLAQIRAISCWISVQTSQQALIEAYCDWFVFMWKRAMVIGPSRNQASLSIVTELVCGFFEIVSKPPDLTLQCWGPPLSHILSFASRSESGAIPAPLLALCLAVGEAAWTVLAKRAVTGRLVGGLLEQYVSTKKPDIAKSRSVLIFCASLVGCRLTAAEALNHMDYWIDNTDVSLIASIVLAGGHCRAAIASSEACMSVLTRAGSEDNEIAKKTIDVLSSTNVRTMSIVAGASGG